MNNRPCANTLPSTTARDLASTFASLKNLGVTDRLIYNQILKFTLENHPEYWGVWSVWKPNALDGRDRDYANQDGHDATGRFAPLWNRSKSGYQVEPNIGYDTPGLGDYFLVPVKQRQELIFDPYQYRPSDGRPRVIVSRVSPIFHQGECVGVAGFDVMAKGDPGIPLGKPLRYSDSHGVRKPYPEPSLTPRENEVLNWLSEGKSNAEIGMILRISSHTVKHHVEKIFAKLGVENRQSAMRCALETQTRKPFPTPPFRRIPELASVA